MAFFIRGSRDANPAGFARLLWGAAGPTARQLEGHSCCFVELAVGLHERHGGAPGEAGGYPQFFRVAPTSKAGFRPVEAGVLPVRAALEQSKEFTIWLSARLAESP